MSLYVAVYGQTIYLYGKEPTYTVYQLRKLIFYGQQDLNIACSSLSIYVCISAILVRSTSFKL